MRCLKTILVLIFLILVSNSYGQDKKKRNFFPIWTYHQKNINIHGISLGIGSSLANPRYTNTNGIRIEIIGAGIIIPLIPNDPVAQSEEGFIAKARQPISEVINGLSISASGTVCDCIINGVNIGFIGHINFQVNGFSTALLVNFSQKHKGVQLALGNESYYMDGVQIGLSNYGHKMKGLQIGLFNKSKKLRGIQIGLWNVNQKRKLPFFNWNFKRDIEDK